jgi:hypothetical protein
MAGGEVCMKATFLFDVLIRAPNQVEINYAALAFDLARASKSVPPAVAGGFQVALIPARLRQAVLTCIMLICKSA